MEDELDRQDQVDQLRAGIYHRGIVFMVILESRSKESSSDYVCIGSATLMTVLCRVVKHLTLLM
jgi:hypothetical protein